mgnify:CR=1 FL=1
MPLQQIGDFCFLGCIHPQIIDALKFKVQNSKAIQRFKVLSNNLQRQEEELVVDLEKEAGKYPLCYLPQKASDNKILPFDDGASGC